MSPLVAALRSLYFLSSQLKLRVQYEGGCPYAGPAWVGSSFSILTLAMRRLSISSTVKR
jgi:hypothetical protein